MEAKAYTERVDRYMAPFLEKNGFVLIRTEFVSEDGAWYLRMFIDLGDEELERRKAEVNRAPEKEEDRTSEDQEPGETPGVSINDCVKISRHLGKWLDKEDFIKETYTMEVCSRGFLEKEQSGKGDS